MTDNRNWITGTAISLAILFGSAVAQDAADDEFDVVIYGGTSAAVTAAVQVHRMGRSVVVVSPDKHLGGLSSGGLGWTDTGNKSVIGGLAREFYHRVWKHYDDPSSWQWQKREAYGNRGQGTAAIDGEQRTMWIFEPHAAERVFEDLVRERQIPVHRDQWLDREKGVQKQGNRIVGITTLAGAHYRGQMFLDATYEGDLLAAAGVRYHVGREGSETYDERWNGVQKDARHHGHNFRKPVDPYVVPGDPASGLLPRVHGGDPGENGAGDDRVQAYCFRMCLTDHPENRVPFAKPRDYDPQQYELLSRVLATGWNEVFAKFDPIPNHKTDTNNHGPFSTDNIGRNYDYPDGSYERRREIIGEHESYQKGLMYFLAHDARVPDAIRKEMSRWGLAKDEFVDNGNWPHQLYIREARRMIGPYIMTEQDCLSTRVTPEPVGMGSYTMDSHHVQRYVTPDGHVQNEGDIGVRAPHPYQISYQSLVPQKDECANLLVPVCISSSHIAFGSIRMEPVFMILGQTAATAAVHAIEHEVAVQDIDYQQLRDRLLADGQVLEWRKAGSSRTGVDPRTLSGVLIDDEEAHLTGDWSSSRSQPSWVGIGYRHDGNAGKGDKSARFETTLEPGRYEVRVAYAPFSNRATRVPIAVHHADGSTDLVLNQKAPPKIGGVFASLGTFRFGDQPAAVVVSNTDTDGHVIVDAVQFVATE